MRNKINKKLGLLRRIKSCLIPQFDLLTDLRLVLTSDGVVVGVVIRRVERYDLVKIKPTESEAEH